MSRILLIEDDPFLASLLKNRFQKENFETQTAVTGDEAIKILQGEVRPDIILLDLILPGKSGFEVLENMRQNPAVAKLPVIVISNLGQDSDIEKVKGLGISDYLIKSKISIDKLIERVKSLLSSQGK